MAKLRKTNTSTALAAIEQVLISARRVGAHWQGERSALREMIEVPGEKLYRLHVALVEAGVDMDKARSFSAGAFKANETRRR